MSIATSNYAVNRTGYKAILYKAGEEPFTTKKLFPASDRRILEEACRDLVKYGHYDSFEIVEVTVRANALDN